MFIALGDDDAPPFAQSFDQDPERLAAWNLAALAVGHRFPKTLACNWKVFWENYNECQGRIAPRRRDLVQRWTRERAAVPRPER